MHPLHLSGSAGNIKFSQAGMLQGRGASEPMETVLVFIKERVFVASFMQFFHDHTNDTCK